MAGLVLDPWQEFVFIRALGEKANGKWSAFEVGVDVPRQNGKGALLEARELTGLFLLREPLIIHSAHQFDTSLEAFRRLLFLIEETPELARRIKRVSKSHGEEGIELKGGPRIRFRTRTKGGGRGFSCDCLILDECMFLPETAHGALLPTLSARPNPQVWYTGSAVDQYVHEDGVVFARVRERGHRGDERLAYFEWSVDALNPESVQDLSDEEVWAQANPGLGIRITAEHINSEMRSMDPRTFAVERLGVGDWPRTDGQGDVIINLAVWDELEDEKSKPLAPFHLAYDVSPDRMHASIALAGTRTDSRTHVEVIEARKGTGWLPDRVAELKRNYKLAAVLCDGAGPAASLTAEIEALGLEIEKISAPEYAQACGFFFDAVEQKKLRHLGSTEIRSAIKGAARRPLGDAWAWSRKNSAVDITPLVASTIATWSVLAKAPQRKPVHFNFS